MKVYNELKGFVQKFRVDTEADGYVEIRATIHELSVFHDSLGNFIEGIKEQRARANIRLVLLEIESIFNSVVRARADKSEHTLPS